MNDSGSVTQDDVNLVLAALGGETCTGCCNTDVNFDGVTNTADLAIVLADKESQCVGRRPVPLVVWPSASSLPLGPRGMSFADFNADGWPDAATWHDAPPSGLNRRLYFNDLHLASPKWSEGCILASPIIDADGYGVAAGDYNNDGYPDYTNEPREGTFLFLVNAGCASACSSSPCSCSSGVANFVSAAPCLGIAFAGENTETNCFGDADGDGDVDLLVSAYGTEHFMSGHGTRFFRTRAAPEANCAGLQSDCQVVSDPKIWAVGDYTSAANLGVLHDVPRPEGAQFVDYDSDGDLDLFVQDVVFQNVTATPGFPLFARLFAADSGIEPGPPLGNPEEGLILADLDMDGDLDLIRNLNGIQCHASRGDGTFLPNPAAPEVQGWGISAADWDNDGDLDVTGGGRWLRNGKADGWQSPFPFLPIEQGMFITLGCPDPASCHPANAIPSWGDVDRDGDLDCARSVFDLLSTDYRFYRNAQYLSECPESSRRYVNVRPVRAVTDTTGPPLPPGRDFTENENGAKVEVVVQEDTSGLRRVQAPSSSGGYLNQNEYLLHFGLPPDPYPASAENDLHFDVYVDFPFIESSTDPRDGTWRVDWTVNPVLAGINLASLYVNPLDPATFGRPVTVYRDGRVRFGATLYSPIEPGGPTARMYTLGGPIRLPAQGGGVLPSPSPPAPPDFAGLQFTKSANTPAVRVREIVVEGQLDQTSSSCDFNIVLLDVTNASSPVTLGGLKAKTVAHNRRTFIPLPKHSTNPDYFVIPQATAARKYELRARMTEYRSLPIDDPAGLQTVLGIAIDGALQIEAAGSNSICAESMTLSSDPNAPVRARLSRKEGP